MSISKKQDKNHSYRNGKILTQKNVSTFALLSGFRLIHKLIYRP
ncbi:hypothetical protein HMPREF0072_2221 [Anaerococcus lactolyticus ATCC 51172]|uniref:Uncharacterized protein n=1 Tax=Anaerococcus lactolyticus ATCC 51172 TaxID=525254 RepID=C2BIQ1_9FIRM|nr:hypothetical protein HMPREF0072_2221 [Anaerococcus lactolyticus ATCC 51172]